MREQTGQRAVEIMIGDLVRARQGGKKKGTKYPRQKRG